MEKLSVKSGLVDALPGAEFRTYNFGVFAAKTSAQHHQLITEALRLATGDREVNPYRYLNRMAKRSEKNGGMTVFLDGSANLYIGPVRSEQDGQTLTVTTAYRFIGA